jgi:hypothetical protein
MCPAAVLAANPPIRCCCFCCCCASQVGCAADACGPLHGASRRWYVPCAVLTADLPVFCCCCNALQAGSAADARGPVPGPPWCDCVPQPVRYHELQRELAAARAGDPHNLIRICLAPLLQLRRVVCASCVHCTALHCSSLQQNCRLINYALCVRMSLQQQLAAAKPDANSLRIPNVSLITYCLTCSFRWLRPRQVTGRSVDLQVAQWSFGCTGSRCAGSCVWNGTAPLSNHS